MAAVPNATRQRPITSTEARDLAARMSSDDLVILPVRHHSPACALQVARAVHDRRPGVVLVEGPRSFTPLIGALTDPAARAPLAVYAYLDPARRNVDAQRIGAYYPFCDFSPELVALRSAAHLGIAARFIDLDLGEQHAVDRTADRDHHRLLDEHHFAFSERLERLAAQRGCADQDDLWESLFEADADKTEPDEHLARLTAYCLLARADATPSSLIRDGTNAREAEMVWHIGQALDDPARSGPVMVVVGGFHAVALPDLLADPPARPAITSPAAHAALIRFSFDRVDRVNGYSAGMPAPAWQQRIWDALTGSEGDYPPRVRATLDALLDVDAELSSIGRPASQPSIADAFAHTLQLAELRQHPAPVRADLLDAIRATLVKGDIDIEGTAVLAATRRVLTGTRLGALPPGIAAPPLVADALDRLRRSRLDVDTPLSSEVTLSVYRSATHRRTSRLLHGLAELEVPFADLLGGPDFVAGTELHLITERWGYRWSPTTESALVEASRYGSTVPEAVAAHFAEHIDEVDRDGRLREASIGAGLLMRACLLGLHDHARGCTTMLADALGRDPSFSGVATATSTLGLVRHAREPLEADHLDDLSSLLRTAFRRSIFLGRLMPAEAAGDVVTGLAGLRELLADTEVFDDPLDARGFWDLVDQLRADHPDAFVRGGCTGMLYGTGRFDAAATTAAVTGSLNGTIGPDSAIDFLRGVMTTAREIAWQVTDLVDALGEIIAGWPSDTFLHHLPGLRLAFAELTPAETDRMAAVVASRLGVEALTPPRTDHTATSVQSNLAVSQRAYELLDADGLSGWAAAP